MFDCGSNCGSDVFVEKSLKVTKHAANNHTLPQPRVIHRWQNEATLKKKRRRIKAKGIESEPKCASVYLRVLLK